MSYVCRICSKEFTDLPPDAIQIAAGRRGTLYKFGDGEIHDLLAPKNIVQTRVIHKRYHKTPRLDCPICIPPVKSEPVQTQLLQEVVQVPEKLPQPNIEEVKPQVATEIETENEEPMTAMAAAFRKFKS